MLYVSGAFSDRLGYQSVNTLEAAGDNLLGRALIMQWSVSRKFTNVFWITFFTYLYRKFIWEVALKYKACVTHLLIALPLGLWVFGCKAYEPIVLCVPHFPPYTLSASQPVSGMAVDSVSQLMTRLDVELQLLPVTTYKRAVESIKSNSADGFFLASQNSERDKIATLSAPLVYNNWAWFYRAEDRIRTDLASNNESLLIATHFGTNTHTWLLQNNYKQILAQYDHSTLPHILVTRRAVDAVFISELVFELAAQETGIASDSYQKVIETAMPFGLYISHAYQQRNPGFMYALNKQVRQLKTNKME